MILSSGGVSSRFFSASRSSSSFAVSSAPTSAGGSVSVRFGLRKCRCPCVVYTAKSVVEAKADECASSYSASTAEVTACLAPESVSGAEESGKRSETFMNVRTEEELLLVLRKEKENGRLPLHVVLGMEELYHNYRQAVLSSGDPKADDLVLSNMRALFGRILLDVEEPFSFDSYHKALREPYDYYIFGQNYIRPLVDFRNSFVGNMHIFLEMEEKLQQGHNIILISNHQSEADPAVIALLLEDSVPRVAEDIIYVAGDRVLTDSLCKPFSMGRNLLCVYSKKHMNDNPEIMEDKRKANTRSLKEMAALLRGGSQIIWIAPSGGRDRPDPQSGEWFPAPFDASAVDNMRRLANHSGIPGHIYSLTLLCYNIMPPPAQVEKEIGEKRVINFHGTGLSVGPEISFSTVASNRKSSEEAKGAYSRALYDSVSEQYSVLKSAVHGEQGLEASTPSVILSQPWS